MNNLKIAKKACLTILKDQQLIAYEKLTPKTKV